MSFSRNYFLSAIVNNFSQFQNIDNKKTNKMSDLLMIQGI